ncbi:MAG: response regulator [Anaerolineaceae bacterium]|nr:response regulator [Anaerolineaceae bacterium]MCB9102194.1 response regulator [Anaerolineales bacterium]
MKFMPTILIIDDQLSVRKSLEGLLIGQGYNLEFASNGFEGLEKASKVIPDLIMLDIMMPKMDGFEVCERLRNDPLLAEVPILMLTALDDLNSKVRGLEVGADDFLSKPFNSVELLARIRTVTRLNRYRRLLSERNKSDWVMEKANDGYIIIDDNDLIRSVNSKACLYLDLENDRHQILGQTFLELVSKQYKYEPQSAWLTWPPEPSTLQAQSPRYLIRPETAISKPFWLKVETLELPAIGSKTWVVCLRDVTEEMSLRRDIHSFHKLISHKLRTPLIGLSNGSELLLRYAAELTTDEIIEFSQTIHNSSQRLLAQINDVLKYKEYMGSDQAFKGMPLSQFSELVSKVKQKLDQKNLALDYSVDLNDFHIALSAQTVELLLEEILENSIKFHPNHDPTINISVTHVDNSFIKIEIGDDGLTLSPEQIVQAWIPYYQGEKYFTGESIGMGLGLSMVASIVWEIGGTCQLHNQKNGPGIVIELTVPIECSCSGKNEKTKLQQ